MGFVESFLIKGFLPKIVSSFEVASFLPGRIRLYSKFLVKNETLSLSVREKFLGYKEIETVEINVSTGSVLILYTPQILRQNPFLRDMEKYLARKARRK